MTLASRREILTTFLGAPLALSACGRNGGMAMPEGQIVGPDVGLGHKLRDGAGRSLAPARWDKVGVVIVGGGVAGLAAAWRLLRAGFDDFVLLELEQSPGGTSRSGVSPICPYPWGAHYLPAPLQDNRALIALLDEMGVLEGRDRGGEPIVAEQFLCRDPEERVFFRGRWYEGLYLHVGADADDRAQLARFERAVRHWVNWRDGKSRRAFAIPTAAGSDDADVTALDRLSMAEWLDQRGFTSPRLRWWVNYACRDDYGATIETTSAWAGLFYFASRVPNGESDARPLITWPEGNGRLVTHLDERCKHRVRTGWAVAEVRAAPWGRLSSLPSSQSTKADTRPSAEVIAIDAAGQPRGFRADRVIFAAPRFVAKRVIREFREQTAVKDADSFQYGSWFVANLFLKERTIDIGFPSAWDNVLYESPSLGYVTATHQLGKDLGPTVLTYYYPLTGDNPQSERARLFDLGWSELADIAMTDLQRAHKNIRAITERLDIMRWGHAMVLPRPGFIWSQARRTAATPTGAVHFAHTDLSGIALFEEAFYHGLRAAEEVLRAKSIRFETIL